MTKRAVYILVFISISYFIANQSGVGWLFVVTSLLIGLFFVSAVIPGRMVRKLALARTFEIVRADAADGPEQRRGLAEIAGQPFRVHEGETLRTTIRISNTGWISRYFVRIGEWQPLAAPAQQAKFLFVTAIGAGRSVHFERTHPIYKRGVYRFDAPEAVSGAPAGLFVAHRTVHAKPAEFWVLPDYVEIDQFPLRRPENLNNTADARSGAGTEIYGTREYRPGDSLRQIHWRSSARISRLVVKEFEQVLSSPVTILLDRNQQAQAGTGTQTTYEYCVRIAASLARFTTRAGHPTYLAGQGVHVLPDSALGWSDILDHLARANADGQASLPDLISDVPLSATLFVTVSSPTPAIIEALLARQRRTRGRSQLVAILCDVPTFTDPRFAFSPNQPYSDTRLEAWEAELRGVGIMTAVCRKGCDIGEMLNSFNTRTRRGSVVGLGKS